MHCTSPENSLTPRQQEVYRVSAFHPGKLITFLSNCNHTLLVFPERHCLEARLKHNLAVDLFCCITMGVSTTRSRNCTCRFSIVCRTVWMVGTWLCTVTSTIRSTIRSFMMVFFALIIMLFNKNLSADWASQPTCCAQCCGVQLSSWRVAHIPPWQHCVFLLVSCFATD